MKSVINMIQKKPNLILAALWKHLGSWCSDRLYLIVMYRLVMGKKLNLKDPQTFNEKIQWLKLYDRKPEYIKMVDKYEAKDYVANIIGREYIIPTIGVWDRPEEIDWDKLPNQFVLKCTHDSGGLVICKDKSKLDKEKAKKKLNRSLHTNYYLQGREWPYKGVNPRVIAEQYMEDSDYHELRDYKFFCFDGKVKALFIATERQSQGEETKFDFFDSDFCHLDIRNGHPNAPSPPAKPKSFDNMKVLAEKLSYRIPFLRVDFYEVNGNIFFGELTFSHWSGLMPFDPDRYDQIFGSWINLPK